MANQDSVDTADFLLQLDPQRAFVPALHVEVSALTHIGLVRSNNEDHFLVTRSGRSLETVMTNLPAGDIPVRFDTTGFAMVVADGMGGHAGGEVASRMAIGTLVRMVLDVPDWIMNLDEANAPRVMERMVHYYRGVDRALAAHAEVHRDLAGMGTTMTIAYSIGTHLFLAHVGDSRCCLFRDASLRQLTRDQTHAQRLVDAGVLPREEVATSRLRHVLTQALGAADPALEVEMAQMQLRPGDRLLLCTDGLTDMVNDAAIATVLAQVQTPAATCKSLVDLALKHGGRDNVTVIVADYASSPA
jgi:serine/threonine protein phosphatase PrpC